MTSGCSAAWLACYLGVVEVVGSNPASPTVFQKEPFGENVEGLSHCGDESCVIETAVQKHDFEQSPLCRVVSGKPLIVKGLREFKNFRRQLGRFVMGTVENVQLQLYRGEPVA